MSYISFFFSNYAQPVYVVALILILSVSGKEKVPYHVLDYTIICSTSTE